MAYTRTPLGGLTEAHLLLVRDRHVLPDDERASIDMMHQGLADLLAAPGDVAHEVLHLLDTPSLDPAHIEAYLAAPIMKAQLPQPQKAQPQTAHPQTAQPQEAQPQKAASQSTKTPEPLLELEKPNAWNNPGGGEKPGSWIFTAGIPVSCPAPTLAA